MKCLSLFSGIGGFDLALQRQGHEIIGACEIDSYARQVYGKHFPGVTIYNDATTLSPDTLPHFDLLCGGFPCQAFSVAGKRLGFDDTRGTLFFEIARIAKEKRPRYLLLENVKGLLFHDKGNTMRTIIGILDELGYDAEWQVINSKYFVPQNRERVFIVGHLRGECTRQVFPLGEIPEIHTEREKTTVARTLTGGGHSGGLHSQMTAIIVNKGTIYQQEKTSCIDSHGQRTMIYHNKSESQSRRIYDINGICPNLGTGHAMSQPLIYDRKYRRLTPLECERLQGFPDGWTEGISDTQRYKCLGNAVTVPVVEYIIKGLVN